MTLVEAFALGMVGSVGIVLTELLEHYTHHKSLVRLPAYYKTFTYWIIRFSIACLGGVVAMAMKPEHAISAIGIGATAPAIMKVLR